MFLKSDNAFYNLDHYTSFYVTNKGAVELYSTHSLDEDPAIIWRPCTDSPIRWWQVRDAIIREMRDGADIIDLDQIEDEETQ